jgi:leucyl aminopeptidase
MTTLASHLLPAGHASATVPIRLVVEAEPVSEPRVAAWAAANGFSGVRGQMLVVPGQDGAVAQVLFGAGGGFDPMTARQWATRLPPGDYHVEGLDEADAGLTALAFLTGQYRFDRYKTPPARDAVRLKVQAEAEETVRIASACALAREMVDTPAADMGPLQIETIAREIAEAHGANLTVTVGEALLEDNYPAIHAVGRAAAAHRQPRLIEIGWKLERTDLPLVALVGKGVVFDTGGLDIKGAAGMRNMKKDMGGAAHVLALARLVMQAGLAVRLVVLVPAVENAISGDAFRPGDILNTRAGLTVEVGNTDAEGRLILSDALTRAGEHSPDLTLDFATLTGAARIALGPELPPVYTDDEALAADLLAAADTARDPLWRMPLWPGYREALFSDIADLKNDSAAWAQAGSVTAALFLQRFAPTTGAWAHLDVFAWNPKSRAGQPEGAEAQGIRAAYAMLKGRFPPAH